MELMKSAGTDWWFSWHEGCVQGKWACPSFHILAWKEMSSSLVHVMTFHMWQLSILANTFCFHIPSSIVEHFEDPCCCFVIKRNTLIKSIIYEGQKWEGWGIDTRLPCRYSLRIHFAPWNVVVMLKSQSRLFASVCKLYRHRLGNEATKSGTYINTLACL